MRFTVVLHGHLVAWVRVRTEELRMADDRTIRGEITTRVMQACVARKSAAPEVAQAVIAGLERDTGRQRR